MQHSYFIRQHMLIGQQGQQKLSTTTVAIIGLGAIGCINAQLLARSGIHNFILVDNDTIQPQNIHRQLLYTHDDIGQKKIEKAKAYLERIFPHITCTIHDCLLDESHTHLLKQANLIIDGTDTMQARHHIEYCAKQLNIPWIFGAAAGTQAMCIPFSQTLTLQQVFSHVHKTENCHHRGILNTTISMLGAIQSQLTLDYFVKNELPQKIYTIQQLHITTINI
ncbi:MAG: HesA/MoeB/ThiF family protein [Candidatus Woesearchaeota archaeon]